ncbi:MAG TPA: hypothetical protein VLB02_02360 [Candidatus Paceibacterota bacterium]|nr:hypothetical protein [Candidatus Paceibacterota bacterium]
MKKEVRQQIYILTGLVLLVLGSSLLLWWAQSGVVARRTATMLLLEKNASIEANRASLEIEYRDFQEVQAAVAVLNKNFYNAQTIPLFLSDVESTAQGAGIAFEITSATVEANKEGGGKHVSVEFNAAGSYAALSNFSRQLKAKPYRLFFDRYYLMSQPAEKSAKGARAVSWKLYGTLRLTTFK